MKSKLMIASLLLAGACAANLNAQEKTNYYTPKWSDNIFVSVGGGVHAINNDGFNGIPGFASYRLDHNHTITYESNAPTINPKR